MLRAHSRILVSLLIFGSVPGSGTPRRAVQSLSAVSYTMKDGLPSNQINVIVQDSRGFLWVGTNNGLSVYDGSGFANYSAVQGLANNWITDIKESHAERGTMWIGTIAGGVCRFSNGRFVAMTNAGSVNVLHEDRQGNLWYVLNDTLYRHGGGYVAHFPTSARGDICELPDGQIAVGLDRSVSFYTPAGRPGTSLELPLDPGDQIYSMTVGRDGGLWVTTNGKCVLLVRDGAVIRRRCFGADNPFFAGEDANGTIWIRTRRGLWEFQHGLEQEAHGKLYTIDDELPETWAGPIAFDREGNMWIGTWAKGLLKVTDRRLLHIDIRALTDATGDAHGHIWFAADDGMAEIFRDESGMWSLATHRRADLPTVPTPDAYGRLWCSDGFTHATLRCLESKPAGDGPSQLRTLYRVPLNSRGVWTSFVDRQERLWVSLAEGDIKVYDLRKLKFVQTADLNQALPRERVGDFYQDREGNVWIGFWSGGLGFFPADGHGPIRLFTEVDGLPNNSIRSICEDTEGRLWVGTRHGGVGVFTNGRFRSITMKEGLQSNSIWQIAAETQGRVWMRTDVGLECIDRASLRVVPTGLELRGERLRSFGVYGNQYLWTLSGGGLWVFDLSGPEERRAPPLVYVKSFSVNDSPRKLLDGQDFSFEEDNCVVEYVSPSFRDERSVRFRYRLLGADTSWCAPTRERSVAYASLTPGSYTFEVLASTPEGGVSPRAATLSFVVRPPFWRTWWFLAATLLAVTGTVAGSVRYFSVQKWRRRVRELEHEQALVEERRRTRERIAGDLHDDVASTLSSVAFFTESLKQKIGETSLEIRSLLQKISTLSLEAEDAVGDIVWSVAPQHDSLQELCVRMRDVGSDLCTSHGIEFRVSFAPSGEDLVLDDAVRKNLYLIFKEGIQNVIKHSHARSVEISICVQDGKLHFSLSDDGTGFTPPGESARKDRGHGLRNMARRGQSVGADFRIESSPGNGTALRLTVPMT